MCSRNVENWACGWNGFRDVVRTAGAGTWNKWSHRQDRTGQRKLSKLVARRRGDWLSKTSWSRRVGSESGVHEPRFVELFAWGRACEGMRGEVVCLRSTASASQTASTGDARETGRPGPSGCRRPAGAKMVETAVDKLTRFGNGKVQLPRQLASQGCHWVYRACRGSAGELRWSNERSDHPRDCQAITNQLQSLIICAAVASSRLSHGNTALVASTRRPQPASPA